MGGRVIDGTMTLAEAQARVDRERARRGKPPLRQVPASAVKSAGPPLRWALEHHSDPGIREPARDAMVLKSSPGAAGQPAARAAHFWTPSQFGLLREYRTHADPAAREAARQALVDQGIVI
jgi:hypothetical protein